MLPVLSFFNLLELSKSAMYPMKSKESPYCVLVRTDIQHPPNTPSLRLDRGTHFEVRMVNHRYYYYYLSDGKLVCSQP